MQGYYVIYGVLILHYGVFVFEQIKIVWWSLIRISCLKRKYFIYITDCQIFLFEILQVELRQAYIQNNFLLSLLCGLELTITQQHSQQHRRIGSQGNLLASLNGNLGNSTVTEFIFSALCPEPWLFLHFHIYDWSLCNFYLLPTWLTES